MSVTHIDNISIIITLSAAPATEASFTTVLLLVDEAAGTGNGLNGARVPRNATGANATTTYYASPGDLRRAVEALPERVAEVVLVTNAFHMERSLLIFSSAFRAST